MKFINEHDEKYLREQFEKDLVNDVTIKFFTQTPSKLTVPGVPECQYCEETGQLLDEVVALSDKLHLETIDVRVDPEKMKDYRIDRVPAVIISDDSTSRVRYYGIPSGYEFIGVIEDLVDISRGTTDISDRAKERLKTLDKDVHIQVFVTPT